MTEDELQAIQERCDKATPGPWYWQGVKSHKTIDLLTVRNGHQRVMGFARWGLNEAAPVFRTENGMERADALATPRQKHRPNGEFLSINHPDAEFIARAREDMQQLIDYIQLLKRVLKSVSYGSMSTWAERKIIDSALSGDCAETESLMLKHIVK